MKWNLDIGGLIFRFVVFIIILFLIFPIIVTIIVSFNKSGFTLPPSGLTIQWYIKALAYKDFISGMQVSLVVAIVSSGIATILGTLSAYALTRYSFKGKDIINILIMAPLMVPVAILGIAIYMFMSKQGMFGGLYTLIIGHTILIMPFPARAILASLQNFPRSLEEAALNVGASPPRAFISITLPIIKTGVIAGMMMAFIISWNDFALSLFLASPGWYPLPIQVYSYIKFVFDPTVSALISTLIFFSFTFVILIDRMVGIGTVMGTRK